MANAPYVFETRRGFGPRVLPLLFFASLLLGGCGHFVPSPPRAAVTSEGLRARVVGLDGYGDAHGFGARVMLAIDDAPPHTRIANAWLVPKNRDAPEHMPCESGVLAERIVVDGVDRSELRADAEALLDFHDAEVDPGREPTRLDLVIDDGSRARCMELEMTSAAPDRRWELEGRYVFGLAQTYEAHTTPVSGADWAVRAMLMGGRWFGPTRISVGVGFMDAGCTYCPPNAKGQARGSGGLALTARADVLPFEAGHFAFGYGVRYSFSTLSQPRGLDATMTLAAYQELSVAPIVALAFGQSNNPMGFHAGPRAGSCGLELPIGIATPLNDYRHPALAIGGGAYFAF